MDGMTVCHGLDLLSLRDFTRALQENPAGAGAWVKAGIEKIEARPGENRLGPTIDYTCHDM